MKKIFILCFILFAAGCSSTTTESDKPSKEATATTDVQSEVGENVVPEEEALKIATEVIEKLQKAPYPEQVGDYILDHDHYVFNEGEIEEIVALKTELVREFATESFINSNIPLDDFNCVDNCTIEIPHDLHYAWKPTINNLTATSFKVVTMESDYDYEIDDFNSFQHTIDFVLENDLWKVNGLTKVQKDLNLQIDEIEAYMAGRGYPDIEINATDETYAYNGRDELVYNITDLEHGGTLIIIARNGNYMYTTATGDIYTPSEGDYSINNEEDYLNYMLFEYYRSVLSNINTNNPTYSNFVYELDNLAGGMLAPLDAGDVEALQGYLQDANVLYEEIYAELSTRWTTDEQQYFDSSYETFNEQLQMYLTNYLPADADEALRTEKEARAIINHCYILLSEQNQ